MSVIARVVQPVRLPMILCRAYSTSDTVKNVAEGAIKKSVFISQSRDIFTNLALEDWFYRNYDFANHHILLLWRNDPCVVIGRHQNPWVEANLAALYNHGIKLARRNSGGGTVYHDNGNLNLTFFTPKQRYDRGYNLNIITRALFREWGLKTIINKRQDIIVQGEFKVSGTAAKLGRPNAYHHCTLLVDVNKQALHLALEKKEMGITNSKASKSNRSSVKNIKEVHAQVNSDSLLNVIGWEYLRTKALSLEDGGHKLIQQQKGFQMINPAEEWFPGINKLVDDFRGWDWIYGKTPEFTVTRMLQVPLSGGIEHYSKLTIKVEKGIVTDVTMSLPENLTSEGLRRDASVITSLRGCKFDAQTVDRLVAASSCKVVPLNSAFKVNESEVAAQ